MNRTIRRTMCILLALVLMSSSAVSYTFAEYARSATAAAVETRSTSWGVNLSVTGGAFATKYVTDDTVTGADISVKSSSNSADIFAPGTTGTFTGIACSGTPETATKIEITPTLSLSNFTDSSGNYYCPLRIKVNNTDYYGLDYSSSAEFKAAVENAIKAASNTYAAGTNLATVPNLNGSYTWTWNWGDSNGTKVTRTDAKDTALQGKAYISLSVQCYVYQVD
ncbi:MAG: hypothetical protein IKU84_01355 [Clostridia bacterium]|nr:hypothetical protein [Clostridia bacterium]